MRKAFLAGLVTGALLLVVLAGCSSPLRTSGTATPTELKFANASFKDQVLKGLTTPNNSPQMQVWNYFIDGNGQHLDKVQGPFAGEDSSDNFGFLRGMLLATTDYTLNGQKGQLDTFQVNFPTSQTDQQTTPYAVSIFIPDSAEVTNAVAVLSPQQLAVLKEGGINPQEINLAELQETNPPVNWFGQNENAGDLRREVLDQELNSPYTPPTKSVSSSDVSTVQIIPGEAVVNFPISKSLYDSLYLGGKTPTAQDGFYTLEQMQQVFAGNLALHPLILSSAGFDLVGNMTQAPLTEFFPLLGAKDVKFKLADGEIVELPQVKRYNVG